ncbi:MULTISPECIES: hypothetical protein [unclassified Burkholderia]|uniref:hypothetical protein n=1 Tax=unclassified Burkholderia TaxID=2613784 RepID=UPI0005CE3A10|nr:MULTISPECIES: hypothetical protein [unclassified Burkholderia]MCR4466959.1 hypothetical protein [Burkholderia sp. SCN-KJ]RQR47009.1 hypothetical protein DIE20_01955 [Burkholderia sp. Bp9131]RQR79895.1 hypothetical protein DIE12_02085 [Burkholderia sp. Bp9015]RQR90506.1 hypothetical protein DIE10_02565 [Burkholderia sp. Bp9011]RQR99512.1 hypothetical protein DIE09_02745 [Burkholderia sp. Bp9010]
MSGLLHDRTGDFIALATLAVLYLGGVGLALWRIRTAAPRGKVYWIVCIALLAGGAIAITANLSPVPNSGEMPPGFALGVEAVLLGLALVAAGCAWLMLRARRG